MVVCIRRISHWYISTPNEGVVVWFRFASLPWPTHSQQIQKSQIRIQPFHVQHIPLDLFPTSIDKDAPAAFAALFATVEIRDEPPPPPSRISSDAPQSGPHPRQSMASITYQSCINRTLNRRTSPHRSSAIGAHLLLRRRACASAAAVTRIASHAVAVFHHTEVAAANRTPPPRPAPSCSTRISACRRTRDAATQGMQMY